MECAAFVPKPPPLQASERASKQAEGGGGVELERVNIYYDLPKVFAQLAQKNSSLIGEISVWARA